MVFHDIHEFFIFRLFLTHMQSQRSHLMNIFTSIVPHKTHHSRRDHRVNDTNKCVISRIHVNVQGLFTNTYLYVVNIYLIQQVIRKILYGKVFRANVFVFRS